MRLSFFVVLLVIATTVSCISFASADDVVMIKRVTSNSKVENEGRYLKGATKNEGADADEDEDEERAFLSGLS
ncbi:unnamed protein product [Phytophthora lilii]|uniref:RxLR effector protein n=1 Tax=Phytophthora lilii TaxID=2077276 RepID=A0A9W6U1Q9_9STRA|nr:unnamed protein product [Phytophthora lilii]